MPPRWRRRTDARPNSGDAQGILATVHRPLVGLVGEHGFSRGVPDIFRAL